MFNAATAKSDLEKKFKFYERFSLDSQTFGSRRDEPDIISKPGSYGYKEFWLGLGNQKFRSLVISLEKMDAKLKGM